MLTSRLIQRFVNVQPVGFSKQNSPSNPQIFVNGRDFLLKWKLWSVYWNCAISRFNILQFTELCFCCKTHFLAYIQIGDYDYTIFFSIFHTFYTCTTLVKTYVFFRVTRPFKVLKRGWFQVGSQQSIRPERGEKGETRGRKTSLPGSLKKLN